MTRAGRFTNVKKVGIVLILFLIAVGFYFLLNNSAKINNNATQIKKESSQTINNNENMKISSPAFENNQKIPLGFSCDGKGDNPPLTFEDVPEDAKSLVLIVEDPDAPGQTFDHWVVYNIDPKTTKVEVRQKPDNGIEGLTSAGSNSFVPPCPPTGSHRYFFKLYALDAMLNLPTGVGKGQVEQAMQGHIVDQAQLVGLYSRGG